MMISRLRHLKRAVVLAVMLHGAKDMNISCEAKPRKGDGGKGTSKKCHDNSLRHFTAFCDIS